MFDPTRRSRGWICLDVSRLWPLLLRGQTLRDVCVRQPLHASLSRFSTRLVHGSTTSDVLQDFDDDLCLGAVLFEDGCNSALVGTCKWPTRQNDGASPELNHYDKLSSAAQSCQSRTHCQCAKISWSRCPISSPGTSQNPTTQRSVTSLANVFS